MSPALTSRPLRYIAFYSTALYSNVYICVWTDSKMNDGDLCQWQSVVLCFYVLWQTYSEGWSLSLRLSLMCFPCVLERQTQLHFNDTQMLQGFRMHVYVCMCTFFCFWPLQWKAYWSYSRCIQLLFTPTPLFFSKTLCLLVYFYICVSVSVHVSAYVNIYANQIEFETLRWGHIWKVWTFWLILSFWHVFKRFFEG